MQAPLRHCLHWGLILAKTAKQAAPYTWDLKQIYLGTSIQDTVPLQPYVSDMQASPGHCLLRGLIPAKTAKQSAPSTWELKQLYLGTSVQDTTAAQRFRFTWHQDAASRKRLCSGP